MKNRFFITFCLIVSLAACCTNLLNRKISPEYQDVNVLTRKLVDEYLELAKARNINFTHKVTVGFKKFAEPDVVGLCTFGNTFREIDVDPGFWLSHGASAHVALIFHELTHCYCERTHDYGKDKEYPEANSRRLELALEWAEKGGERPGYWDDGCPISLMYPIVVDDDCIAAHYKQYVDEMFDRCKPY